MKSYVDVQKQIAKLQAEAEALKRREMQGVITRIQEAIAHYGLTAANLFGRKGPGRPKLNGHAPKANKRSTSPLTGRKVPIKYQDKATGQTWTGRGTMPIWLRTEMANGKKLEDFKL